MHPSDRSHRYFFRQLESAIQLCQCGHAYYRNKRNRSNRRVASHHIVPWKSAYGSKDLIGIDARFVLAANCHVAGVINPPARNKRSHWLNDQLVLDPDSWLERAEEKSGSWWPDWDAWMKQHSMDSAGARRASEEPPHSTNAFALDWLENQCSICRCQRLSLRRRCLAWTVNRSLKPTPSARARLSCRIMLLGDFSSPRAEGFGGLSDRQ